MDEKYRLVFRGEVLDGQHRAVVKRRLMEALNLTESQREKLFSGDAVVLKKAADASTAASYQGIFKKAGGRLRVMPVEEEQQHAQEQQPTGAAADAASAASFSLVTADVPVPSQPAPEIEAPDFAVAEVGAVLVEAAVPVAATVPEVDFELAEVGADLLLADAEVEEPPPPIVDFELADVGADIGAGEPRPAGPPPDTSHIQLAES